MRARERIRRLASGAGLGVAALVVACGAADREPVAARDIPVYSVKIVNVYPHDTGAFTQGLVYDDGFLYEGTGQLGASSIRKVKLETGEVLREQKLGDQYFGEGVALVGDRLVQLTWTSRVGFVFEKETLREIGRFEYLTEGWGLTYDGARLIMSDGSANLQFLDPSTYQYRGFVTVRAGDIPVQRINELEYVDGEIFANIWPGNRIARIDLSTGAVVGWIEVPTLLKPEDLGSEIDVLNGIAWDAEGRRLFLTGKLWPKLFEVEIVRVAPESR